MKVEQVTKQTKQDFITFCIKHRNKIDDSYISDRELELFTPLIEPAYIIRNDKNDVIGAVSLMLTEDYKHTKKARFRIFYSVLSNQFIYQQLLNSINHHLEKGDYTYAFTNETAYEQKSSLQEIGFQVERYVYVLERDDLEITPAQFSEEYMVKTFEEGKDEPFYCLVRNEGFKQLIGYTPLTTETVKEMRYWEDHLEDGILLLFHNEKPVGVVRTGKDYFKNAHYAAVNSLPVIPEYQGKGLGRQLLRASLIRGKEKGLEKGFLCVNAENEGAAKLYEQEDFYKTESFVCYYYIKQ